MPPELLFRILTFVGLTGGPSSLRSCNLSCKGFYEIIEDPALDKFVAHPTNSSFNFKLTARVFFFAFSRYIYRAAAFSLLSHDARLFPQHTLSGTRVPPTTSATSGVTKQTFKALARTLHLSRRPFPASLHHTSTTSIPPKGLPCPTTRHGPHPATHNWDVNDEFRALTFHKNELSAARTLPPLSVDPQGRPVHRIIDFVHSSTEASRTEEGVAYIGVKTCGWSDALPPGKTSPRQGETASWILFSDDPRVFPEKRDRGWITVQRAAILGGTPSASSSNMPLGQRLQRLHQEKVEAAGKRKKVDPTPYGTPPPPTARDIAEAEAAWNPFIKPIDHDKFLNAQRWGDITRGLNASTYKALPKSKPILPQQERLAAWTMTNVCDAGLVGFGKCLLHSDANLRLVPRLVQRQLEVAQVERLSMENSDGDVEVNMVWEMPRTVKELSLDPMPTDDDLEPDWDEDISEVNWEFKSCGEYLVVCDDNSGRRASTISCFFGHVPTTAATKNTKQTTTKEPLRWQRRMVVKRADGAGEYLLDNDGISINSSVVAYSTRRHIHPGNAQDSHRAAMEFHILSLRTGDTIKVLNLAEEERSIAQRCWMWCSVALGDGILVASLGGLGAAVRRDEDDGGPWAGTGRRKRYGYENLFVWDLGDESSASETAQVGVFRGETEVESRSLAVGPRGRIPVPQGWGEVDKYVVLSGCGRFLGVCAEWKMAVWDLEQKTFDGVWRVSDAGKSLPLLKLLVTVTKMQ